MTRTYHLKSLAAARRARAIRRIGAERAVALRACLDLVQSPGPELTSLIADRLSTVAFRGSRAEGFIQPRCPGGDDPNRARERRATQEIRHFPILIEECEELRRLCRANPG